MKPSQPPEAIFCDRDGTLIQDVHFLSNPNQVEWLPGVLEALKVLEARQVPVFVVTNQSGVARGYFGIEVVEAVHDKLRRDVEAWGGSIADFAYCPHHPEGNVAEYSYVCDCRKPFPGMFQQAIRKHALDPKLCWAFGDRLRDLEPALQLGMTAFLVETGYGQRAKEELQSQPYAREVTVLASFSDILSLLPQQVSGASMS